jgi:RND superfamily putative drug exporter
MSKFLFRLGQRCARHPWRVLGLWLLVALTIFGLDHQLGGETKDNFTVPGVEAQQASDLLKDQFPALSGASGQIVFHVDHGTLAEPANEAAIEAALDRMRTGDDVSFVSDPFDPRGPTVSKDGRTAFATVNYSVDLVETHHTDQAAEAAAVSRDAGVQTELTGTIAEVEKIEGHEAIGLLVAVIVLLVAFGSLIAMGIPIVSALIGLVMGLSGVGIMAYFVDTPVTSTMIASMIGLGVGIDYALFVVTRHRQHLAEGMSVEDAAGVANATAGQSVLFAGMTVVIAITGLVMAGLPAVTAMGFAAAIVVLFAMFVAVTLLPACLGLAGRHIDRWSLPHRTQKAGTLTFSGKWAHHVGKRPWRYAIISFVALVALAAPVVKLTMGFTDDSNTGADTTQHHAYDLLTDNFGKGFNGPFTVVIDMTASTDPQAVQHVAAAIKGDPGVAAVQPPLFNEAGNTAVLFVQPTTSPQDTATDDTVKRLRSDVIPPAVDGTGTEVLVGGRTAMLADLSVRITDRLPLFILAVVALSFILLMMVFRSLLVPLKAAIMNLLSIGAAYGIIVAVFQWGWGKGPSASTPPCP